MKRTVENIKDPLYRFFERETVFGARLLGEVRTDLEDVVAICEGSKKQSNHHRALTAALNRGMVPEQWNRYKVPAGVTVMAWVEDLAQRVAQLQKVSAAVKKEQAKGLKGLKVWLGGLFTPVMARRPLHPRVWLGGLFNPEAYITATRQLVAQANEWSLEELQLHVLCANDFGALKADDCSFPISGLKMMGGGCEEGNQLRLSDAIFTDLAAVLLQWRRLEGGKRAKAQPNHVSLPVYRYPSRSELLFTLDFVADSPQAVSLAYERGLALIAANHLG